MMSSVSEVTGEDELTLNMVRFSLVTASLGVVVPLVLTTGEREATASVIYKLGALHRAVLHYQITYRA